MTITHRHSCIHGSFSYLRLDFLPYVINTKKEACGETECKINEGAFPLASHTAVGRAHATSTRRWRQTISMSYHTHTHTHTKERHHWQTEATLCIYMAHQSQKNVCNKWNTPITQSIQPCRQQATNINGCCRCNNSCQNEDASCSAQDLPVVSFCFLHIITSRSPIPFISKVSDKTEHTTTAWRKDSSTCKSTVRRVSGVRC
jgi:hypothetical protein